MIIERFFFNESINSWPIHVYPPRPDGALQTAGHKSLLPLTAGPIKGWVFWSDGLKQSFTWREEEKKRTYHNAINHVRALWFSQRHGRLQKASLIKFYSFCTDLRVKPVKAWSGTGAGCCRSKRHLDSFARPLKWTQRPTRAKFLHL